MAWRETAASSAVRTHGLAVGPRNPPRRARRHPRRRVETARAPAATIARIPQARKAGMQILKWPLVAVATLAALTLLAAQLGAFNGRPSPTQLGHRDGRLEPPSKTPNSVSSQADMWLQHPMQDHARIATVGRDGRRRSDDRTHQARRRDDARREDRRKPRRLPVRAVQHPTDEVRRRRRVLVRPWPPAWCRCARHRAWAARTSA